MIQTPAMPYSRALLTSSALSDSFATATAKGCSAKYGCSCSEALHVSKLHSLGTFKCVKSSASLT